MYYINLYDYYLITVFLQILYNEPCATSSEKIYIHNYQFRKLFFTNGAQTTYQKYCK
jgi:hypothetical protein